MQLAMRRRSLPRPGVPRRTLSAGVRIPGDPPAGGAPYAGMGAEQAAALDNLRDALNRAATHTAGAPAAAGLAPPPTSPVHGMGVDLAFRDRLMAINTPALADANKEGLRVMDHRLRPLNNARNTTSFRFAGVARTVRCYNDFLTVIAALADSSPGEVLVIDTQDSTRTVGGELFATESQRRGLAALLIDGPCRDTAQIAPMALPVYCTSIRPVSGTANKIYETQVPVSCGGVPVDPGDWVFGDSDGVIVGSRAEFEACLDTAEAIVRNEEAAVVQPRSTPTNSHPRSHHQY